MTTKNIVELGPNYKKVTLCHPNFLGENYDPGKCARINGKWLVIAGSRKNEIDVVVQSKSLEEFESIKEIDYPVGPGYQFLWINPAILVVGGSGLGAAVRILEQRNEGGLKTSTIIYSKGISAELAIKAFPSLKEVNNIIFWDTTHKGRPKNPLDPINPQKDCHVFFAGPKSLHEALKKDPRRPDIHLNF